MNTQEIILICVCIIVMLGFWVAALVDLKKREFLYPNSKKIWLALLILLPPLGIILYFIVGKQQRIQSIKDMPRTTSRSTKLDEVLKILEEKNKKRKLFS